MLVYGDPRFRESLASFGSRLLRLVDGVEPQDLDLLRKLLIQTGQLEQGIFDEAGATEGLQRQCVSVTDAVAQAFVGRYVDCHEDCREYLKLARQRLEAIDGRPDLPLTIKIPEGYEFYCLYPEQYCASALRWIGARKSVWPKRALVVGIRSIGTSLSAVVRAVLLRRGWQALRLTVRPMGHPFARRIELAADERKRTAGWPCALVVDEGPGISGSSMAAAAEALSAAGFCDIAFLPGHCGEPGPQADARVRAWWSRAERFVTPCNQLRWVDGSLTQALLAKSSCLTQELPPRAQCTATAQVPAVVADLGGGLWRQHAFQHENQWPAVIPTFERAKFKCQLSDGRAVLWKFCGLGSAGTEPGPAPKAGRLNIPQQLRAKSFRGFSAELWVEGRRLTVADGLHDRVLETVGDYIIGASEEPLTEWDHERDLARLLEMLTCNTQEALGNGEEQIADYAPLYEAARRTRSPLYGDGRLGPWEWVETANGELIKTDWQGHARDHTLIGAQSVLWDLAGAIVEWNLPKERRQVLIGKLAARKLAIDPAALTFYLLAYAAFRLGLHSMFTAHEREASPECQRLKSAANYYRATLVRNLAHA